MFKTLRWAINAMLHATIIVDRRYVEEYKMYVPGLDVPSNVEPGHRVEISLYPVGKEPHDDSARVCLGGVRSVGTDSRRIGGGAEDHS